MLKGRGSSSLAPQLYELTNQCLFIARSDFFLGVPHVRNSQSTLIMKCTGLDVGFFIRLACTYSYVFHVLYRLPLLSCIRAARCLSRLLVSYLTIHDHLTLYLVGLRPIVLALRYLSKAFPITEKITSSLACKPTNRSPS